MPATVPAFEREGCAPFEYGTKTGKRAIMSYWRLPDRLYDDPDELAQWARAALAVAHKGAAARAEKAREEESKGQATAAPPSLTSGSISHITRLRPWRLAA